MNPMIALMGIQMVSSIINGRKAAKASSAAAEANRIASINAMVDETSQLNEQHRQQDEIGHAQELSARLKALHAESTTRSQNRNIQGNSIDKIGQEFLNVLGGELSTAKLNREGRDRALKMQKKGSRSKAQSRINSTPAIGYNPVNDIVQGGLSMYSANQSQQLHDMQMAGGTK